MKVSYQYESLLEDFVDHDTLIRDLIEGRLEWAVSYEAYPSGRKRIFEISLVPCKTSHPKAHFIRHEAEKPT